MVDEQNIDYFSDGDLAEAENLPVGPRYIGYVSKVDTANAEPGQFRKFAKPLKDGRVEVPEINVDITALAVLGNHDFGDANYYKTATINYWIGTPDKIGRHALAGLIERAGGVSKEELVSAPIKENAKRLEKAYVTFEVKHRKYATRSGGEGTAQDFTKVRAATPEEVEKVL